MERRRLLDSEYLFIEKIHSNGSPAIINNAPRIETNIYADENTEIFFDFQSTEVLVGHNPCGVRNPNLAVVTFGSSGKFGAMIYGNSNIQAIPFDQNRHTYLIGNGKFIIDGVSYGNPSKVAFSSNVPITFFMSNGTASDGSGTWKAAAVGDGYSAWIKKNGVLVFNGVPIKRKKDGRVGMLDTVSLMPYFGDYGLEFTE